MKKSYTLNLVRTASDDYIKDIKQAMIDKGIVEETVPDNELDEAISSFEGEGPEWDGDYSEDGELPKPSGAIDITTMDIVDVTNYASAQVKDNNLTPENIMKDVNILGVVGIAESGITPSGTLDIEENGTYDVTEKANVNVNVAGSDEDRLKAFFDVKKSCYHEFIGSPVTTEELNSTLSYDDTSKVTNMKSMFDSCSNLTSIPQLDTSSVTNMQGMFANCSSLTSIPLLNTSKVTDMSNMFYSCSKLTTIPQLDTSSVTDMLQMFISCSKLTSIPQLDVNNVTNMQGMFNGCSSLTSILLLNTGNVTNMQGMFNGCSKLTTIPQLDTSSVTSMNSMFNSCSNLTTVPQLDTSNVTDMGAMFNYCTNLTTITQLDTINVTSMNMMFRSCKKLTSVVLNNIKVNLTVGSGTSYGHLLTVDSLVGLCKECIKQSSSRTLTIGTANLAKLADVYVRFVDINQTEIAEGEKGEVEVCEADNNSAMTITEYMTLKSWTLA